MTSGTYPLLVPPRHLAERLAKEWSDEEAKEYFEWLMSAIDERVHKLMAFCGDVGSGSPADILGRVGLRVASILPSPEFSFQGELEPELTDRGYALAADMGLLVARLLHNEHKNKLRWTFVRKPKSHVSYHLPVLSGFMYDIPFDPIAMSVGNASAVLRRTAHPDIWQRAFAELTNKIKALAYERVFEELVDSVHDKHRQRELRWDREMDVVRLGNLRDPPAEDVFVGLLNDDDEGIVRQALIGLRKLRNKVEKAGPHIERFVTHPKAKIRTEAKRALASVNKALKNK